MMTHEGAADLLGAYALDAVDGEEQRELEAHLETCPRCRAELDSLRDVAGALGNSVESPPEGLWSGIASRLPERPAADDASPMPRLGEDEPSPFRAPRPAARRHRRGLAATVGAFAVAAAAVAAVLGIGLVQANDKVTKLQHQQASGVASGGGSVAAALRTPGHRVVTLDSSTHAALASFVMLPDGRGYMLSSSLPRLSTGHVYQLWGVVGSQPISLGVLGSSPRGAGFTMAGSVQPSRLSITDEPAGGSVIPSGDLVATGVV